jgi:hypothetical protein
MLAFSFIDKVAMVQEALDAVSVFSEYHNLESEVDVLPPAIGWLR